MTRAPLPTLASAIASAALLAGCADTPAEPQTAMSGHDAHVATAHVPDEAAAAMDLAALRLATARYHRVEAALADGYLAPPPTACVAAPPGGMGLHYVKPAHMDLSIDPTRPEAILYEPMENGDLRLVAAEFLVHGDAWDAVNAGAPTFAGIPFDPPTDRAAAAPPGPFYTLHVWIWKENPSGMFAPFNPRVTCS